MLSSESPEGVRIRGTGKLFFFGVFETKWEYSGGRTERTRLVYDLSVWVHMEVGGYIPEETDKCGHPIREITSESQVG